MSVEQSSVQTPNRITVPLETIAPPIKPALYENYRLETDIREPYRIPHDVLKGTRPFIGNNVPESPLIAFINARSGGKAGPGLAQVLYRALGHSQVFDLSETRPQIILDIIEKNLQKIVAGEGGTVNPTEGQLVKNQLRVLAAGGDGTVAWVLKSIRDLKLDPQPAVAIMPLGTGNDLSRTFHWGGQFNKNWIKNQESVYYTLKKIADAKIRKIDTWLVSVTCPHMSSDRWIGSMPHSLQVVQAGVVQGYSWNYVSFGMDAKAAYGFHHLRETKPHLARTRALNKFWYGWFACKSGWFCGAQGITNRAKVFCKFVSDSEEWQELSVPPKTRAIVLLNIGSYGGGRDLWGEVTTQAGDQQQKPASFFNVPRYDDGLIEVVGLNNGWHTGAVMSGVIHGARLAQARAVRVDLQQKGPAGPTEDDVAHAYLQLDGEPWEQTIPTDDDAAPLSITLTHAGVSNMLDNSQRTFDSFDSDNFTQLAPQHKQRINAIRQETVKRRATVEIKENDAALVRIQEEQQRGTSMAAGQEQFEAQQPVSEQTVNQQLEQQQSAREKLVQGQTVEDQLVQEQGGQGQVVQAQRCSPQPQGSEQVGILHPDTADTESKIEHNNLQNVGN